MAFKEISTEEKCSYKCGQVAKFQNSTNGKLICCDHHNKCPAVRRKNSSGLKIGYENGSILPKSHPSWNKGLTKEIDSRVLNGSIKSSEVLKNMTPHGCCSKNYQEEQKLKFLADSKRGGGYRKNSGRSKGKYLPDSFGKLSWLQSTFEIRLAEILDVMGVRWIRPEPLSYVDDKKENRRYFADFYLPDFDLYLEPKNDYLIKKEKRKFEILGLTYSNIILMDESKIKPDFVRSLLTMVP